MNSENYKIIEHPRIIFFLIFFSYTIGIGCSVVGDLYTGILLSLLISVIIVFLGGWRRWYIYALVSLMSLGGWYIGYQENISRQLSLGIIQDATHNFSGSYRVSGIVENVLYISDLTKTYRLKIDTIDTLSPGHTRKLGDRDIGLLLEVPNNLHINSGDTIEYTGKISKVINFPLEGFSRYGWYHQVYGKSMVPMFKIQNKGKQTPLAGIQTWAKNIIFRGFPDSVAGVILGMTIGNIELLSSETKKSFTNAGITHILVVSGSNIAFVIVILTGILRYLPIKRFIRVGVVCIFVFLYGSLVGWDMPVIRAVAMGLITYMAIEGGKRASSLSVLFLVCWTILIYSPLALLYDAGFGLSFAGTLGILLFHKIFHSYLSLWRIPQFLSEILSVTLAASIGSTIALIYHFGSIPIFTLASNILISGVLGWILFASVVYLFLAPIGGWILYGWGWLIYLPTAYVMWVGKLFGESYSYTFPKEFTVSITLFLIGIMISTVLLMERKRMLESK